MRQLTAILLAFGACFMAAKSKAQPKNEKPVDGVKADANGKLPKGTVSKPWNEVVKVDVIDPKTGKTVKTYEAVDAYRVRNGNVALRVKQTVVYVVPGSRVVFADGSSIIVKKATNEPMPYGVTFINDPIPPPLKPGTIVPRVSESKAVQR